MLEMKVFELAEFELAAQLCLPKKNMNHLDFVWTGEI